MGRRTSKGRLRVTVDTRGTRFGSEASYGLAVSQTTLEPSPTPTVAASLTPSPTRTRLVKRDDYDNAAANNSCRYAPAIKWTSPLLLYTSPNPRNRTRSRMPPSA